MVDVHTASETRPRWWVAPDSPRVPDAREPSFCEFIEHLAGLRIAARAAATEMAERLEVATGSPLQYFEQVAYLDDGRTIERCEVWVRSDRVRLTSMVSRGPAGGAQRGPATRGDAVGSGRARRMKEVTSASTSSRLVSLKISCLAPG